MNPDTMNYPIKTTFIRWQLVTDFQTCPECGGHLDTGNECNSCGYDAMPIAKSGAPHQQFNLIKQIKSVDDLTEDMVGRWVLVIDKKLNYHYYSDLVSYGGLGMGVSRKYAGTIKNLFDDGKEIYLLPTLEEAQATDKLIEGMAEALSAMVKNCERYGHATYSQKMNAREALAQYKEQTK